MTRVGFSAKPGISEAEVDGKIAAAPKGGLAIFGDGSDGNHTVTATYSGGPITSNALTRDAFFNNLTIDNGAALDTAGYRIFVKGTLTNNGTIKRNGNVGIDGLTNAEGPGGAGLSEGSLGGSAAGGNGADSLSGSKYLGGGGGSGGGVILIAAKIIDNSSGIIQANGGDGGNVATETRTSGTDKDGQVGVAQAHSLGGDGGTGGGAAGYGAPGSSTVPTASKGGFKTLPFAIILKELESTVFKIAGGAGGGGSGLGNSPAQYSGGGGGGGAIVVIYSSATWGTEEVDGGTGGANDAATGTVIKMANV